MGNEAKSCATHAFLIAIIKCFILVAKFVNTAIIPLEIFLDAIDATLPVILDVT